MENQQAQCCDICYNEIEVIDSYYCPKCGKRRETDIELCYDCSEKPHVFEMGRGMYSYEGRIKKSLFGLKFFNQTWVGEVFGKLLSEYYQNIGFPAVDLVIPIPLHFFRQYKRGYNQAEIIAARFCKELKLDLEARIIRRSKWTKPQKDLSDLERIENMKNAFSIPMQKVKIVKGKKILIIDDIYTTGTTIDCCSKLLYESGAECVYFLTIAIGNGI